MNITNMSPKQQNKTKQRTVIRIVPSSMNLGLLLIPGYKKLLFGNPPPLLSVPSLLPDVWLIQLIFLLLVSLLLSNVSCFHLIRSDWVPSARPPL